jgi:hypothetical protein
MGLLRFGFTRRRGLFSRGHLARVRSSAPRHNPRARGWAIEGGAGHRLLQSTKTVSYPVRSAVFRSRRVSPVAMVHPVVVVSPGVAVLAALRVVAVSSVLAMRWFSFVQ